MNNRFLCCALLLSVAVPLSALTSTPTIYSLSYSCIIEGSPDITLVVNGDGFVPGSTLRLGTNSLATTQISSSQITAIVPASLTVKPTSYYLSVINPDGTTSTSGGFLSVTPLFPAITSLSPNLVAAGGGSLTLTINGQNFLPGAQVYFNNNNQPFALTPFSVTATQIQVTVPASLVGAPGTIPVFVANTDSNRASADSNAVTFRVGIPAPSSQPVISSFTPASYYYLGPDFVLSVAGANFDRSSAIRFAGAILAATYVDSSHLTATIPTAQQASCPMQYFPY